MFSGDEELSYIASLTMQWSTMANEEDSGLFDDDPLFNSRVRKIGGDILEVDLTNNEQVVAEFLTLAGATPPYVHCPFLVRFAQRSPETLTRALNGLSAGSLAQKAAYRTMITTLGSFARHGLLVDIMNDEEMINQIAARIQEKRGE